MSAITEPKQHSEFLLSEAAGNRSRDTITVVSGQNLKAGDVIGKTVTAGTVTGAAAAGNTGNGTIGTLSAGARMKEGVYRATCIEPATNAGTFQVEDPYGAVVGVATVAVAFTGEVNFTIADGATDFVAGDSFLITATQATEKWKVLNTAATDGTEIAAGIVCCDANATAADVKAPAYVRDCEVNGAEITWPAGITAANKDLAIARLADRGIIVR